MLYYSSVDTQTLELLKEISSLAEAKDFALAQCHLVRKTAKAVNQKISRFITHDLNRGLQKQ